MNKGVLTTNLIRLKHLGDLTSLTGLRNIPVILLKGIALIEVFPEYLYSRNMEDADLLFRPGDMAKVRELLKGMGYLPAKSDPWSYRNNESGISFDLNDGIWYMEKRELEKLWQESLNFPIRTGEMVYHLPPADFYVHVLAHAAVHHARKEINWLEDLRLIENKWKDYFESGKIESALKYYGLIEARSIFLGKEAPLSWKGKIYKRMLRMENPLKGHILRFLLLPLKKQFKYVIDTLLPSNDFIKSRYDLSNDLSVFFFKMLRPFLLLTQLLRFTPK
jgi:hypothetical protein